VTEKKSPSNANSGLPSARRKARHYAMQSLYQWQMTKNALSDIEMQFRLDYEKEFKKVDLAFYQDLLHQVPANLTEVEAAFSEFLDRDISELDPIELAVLRLGSYELIKRIDVPYKVVINESVALTKKFGAADGHKYINGVLDKLARKVRTVEVGAEQKK
jgi:N utilization substance protein B